MTRISGPEADMETKRTTFAFHLPAGMLINDTETPIAQLCSRTSRQSSVVSYIDHDLASSSGWATGNAVSFSISIPCRADAREAIDALRRDACRPFEDGD
jgi:hypothetical protein